MQTLSYHDGFMSRGDRRLHVTGGAYPSVPIFRIDNSTRRVQSLKLRDRGASPRRSTNFTPDHPAMNLLS